MKQHSQAALSGAFGIQHAHDEFYFRPLILGDNLFTYVAHIPVGGGVSPYPVAAEKYQIEHSLYVLGGELKITIDDRTATLVPHSAACIPAGKPFELLNTGDATATVYMVYTPSRWGTSASDEDRQGVTSLEEMRLWYGSRGQRLWSAEEMNSLAGDSVSWKRDLPWLINSFRPGDTKGDGENLLASLWRTPGYRHEHKPNPPDDFWFRPIVCGERHLTYVGLVPAGKGVPPSPEEAGHVEMSIYTLAGNLGCIILGVDGEEEHRLVLPAHHAIYAPLDVPIGFFSPGEETAVFLLSFTPTRPGRDSIAAFENWAVNTAGWTVVDPDSLNEMLGHALWD